MFIVDFNGVFSWIKTGNTVVRAGESLEQVKFRDAVGLRFPGRIYANNLRKHTATIAQVHFEFFLYTVKYLLFYIKTMPVSQTKIHIYVGTESERYWDEVNL